MKKILGLSAAVIIQFNCASVYAESTLSSSIALTLTLEKSPACTINNNQPVSVNMGDNILTSRVDGTNYATLLPLNLDCSDTGANDTLKFTINGMAAPFDTKVLGTDKSGLGIKFTTNNKELGLGESLLFNNQTPPVIYAVPVKEQNIKLTGGDFTASATIQTEYQ